MTTTVKVKVFFEAAHRLHNPAQSDEWNRRVFGKCNNPHGHGHNYVIEAAVTGEVDPETGYLIDMKDLSHTMGVGCTRSKLLNLREGAYHGVVNDWGEVVTR